MTIISARKGYDHFSPDLILENALEADCQFKDCEQPALHDGEASFLFCKRHMMTVDRKVGIKREVLESLAPIVVATEARPDVQSPGVVYFMLKGDLVKIGFTTDLKKRAANLKVDRVLAYFPGTMYDERTAHDAFAQWRSHGEWFHATPECLAYIHRLTNRAN